MSLPAATALTAASGSVRGSASFIARSGALREPDCVALRCLIVDDSEEFLASARRLLSVQGLDIVGVATSAEEALQLASHLHPEVVLVDVHLGADDGLALARELPGTIPAAQLVLISTHPLEDLVELLAGVPAAGFLSKSELSAEAIVDLVESASL